MSVLVYAVTLFNKTKIAELERGLRSQGHHPEAIGSVQSWREQLKESQNAVRYSQARQNTLKLTLLAASKKKDRKFPELITSCELEKVEIRYAVFLSNLNPTPKQLERLYQILANRDLGVIGVSKPLTKNATLEQVTEFDNEVRKEIESVVGSRGYLQFTQDDQLLPTRNLLMHFQNLLSAAGIPLSPAQSEKVAGMVMSAASSPDSSAVANSISFKRALAMGSAEAQVSNDLLSTFTDVIPDEQLAKMKAIYEEQQAAQKVDEQFSKLAKRGKS